MTAIPAEIGAEMRFAKTLGETDFYLFSGISGDFDKVHVNEEHMRTTVFGRRIAHGILVLALSSTCCTRCTSARELLRYTHHPILECCIGCNNRTAVWCIGCTNPGHERRSATGRLWDGSHVASLLARM